MYIPENCDSWQQTKNEMNRALVYSKQNLSQLHYFWGDIQLTDQRLSVTLAPH